jgi:hypothetical protein
MEDINKSNKQPESPSDHEEDIIDLVDKVSSDDIDDDIDHAFDSILDVNDDDDEIIELVDRVDLPPGTPSGEEETIIDLLDIVTPEDSQLIGLKSEDNADDAVIELTEILDIPADTAEGDDEIINLTEAVEQDETANAELLPTDAIPDEDVEEVIELNDQLDIPVADETEEDDNIGMIDSESPEDESAGTDHTIEDIAEEPAPDDTAPLEIEASDVPVTDEFEEDVLLDGTPDISVAVEPDLLEADTNEMMTAETDRDDQSGDETIEMAPTDQEPEQIIQLADVLNSSQTDGLMDGDVQLDIDEALEDEEELSEPDATASVLGIELDDIQDQQLMPLTDKEIDDAVERVIQRKYGASIEELIANAVEKAVSREIESLKRSIMDNDAE